MGECEHGHTGATVNAILVNFDLEGIGDGSFYDWIPGAEARQIQGYDKKGQTQISEWKTHGCTRRVMQHLHQHEHPHQRQKLPRSRTENNKTSTWDTMVVT